MIPISKICNKISYITHGIDKQSKIYSHGKAKQHVAAPDALKHYFIITELDVTKHIKYSNLKSRSSLSDLEGDIKVALPVRSIGE